MKKLIFILMLSLAAGAAQAQVKFETKSTDAVREMAVKTGKLVFIDLYATWCPPCRLMEREVVSRKDAYRGRPRPTSSWTTCKRSSTGRSPNRESNHLGSRPETGGTASRCTSQRLTAAATPPAIPHNTNSRSEKAREFIMMHSPQPQQARHGSDVVMTGT